MDIASTDDLGGQLAGGSCTDALLRSLIHDSANLVMTILLETRLAGEAPGPPAQVARHIGKIEETVLHFKNLLSRIRIIRALAVNPVTPPLAPSDLRDAIVSVARELKPALDAKRLRLETEIPSGSWRVDADERELTDHVLKAVLDNAVKYSYPDSRIQIRVAGSEDGSLLLSVVDDGIGMPVEVSSRLFAGECGVRRPGTAGEKGIGHSLLLAQIYLERIRGQISVRSSSLEDAPDQAAGTTITIRLPRA